MIQSLINAVPLLSQAVWETLVLSFASIAGALVLGFVLAELALHGGRVTAHVVGFLTQFLRGTPVLVFVFLVYYLLPVFSIRIDKIWTAILSLSIFFSVFFSEIFRGAVAALPRGQRQSALALGMSRWEIERIVVLPQAFRIALPSTLNLAAIIVKSTSVVSVIGVWELTYATNELVMRTMQPFLYFLTAMGLYFCICYGLVHLGHRLQHRLNISYKDS